MKKTLKIVLALAAMSLAFAFTACNNSSDNSAALMALASATNAAASTTSFSGTYTGSISLSDATKGSMTLYCTVVGTGNNYTVKAWKNQAKTGEANINSPGTFTISGNTFSGKGSDHSISGTTTDGGATWSFTVTVPDVGTFTGTVSKQ